MNNIMDNGAVLPSGLLGHSDAEMMAGYNQSFKNFALRVGVITAIYPVDDDKNISDLNTEYDVMVVEQNADRGATTIIYRNCLAIDALGSPADFFEKTLRAMEDNTSGNDSINLNDQNGATVLLMCLDGVSDKGIIMGAISHPDRDTTLETDEPRLEGEYNGVNVKVEPDGSCKLTFQGATDNDGEPTDDSQGDTTIQIEQDGSFQIDHDTITFRLDRDGTATLTTENDVIVDTQANLKATVQEDATVDVQGNVSATVQGNIDITCQGDTTINVTGNVSVKCAEAKVESDGPTSIKCSEANVTSSGKTVITASEIDLNGAVSGITTMNSHQGVIDLITGVPVLPSMTVMSDV